MNAQPNTRPCGLCKHLDAREKGGVQFCWATWTWRKPDDIVTGCDKAARADGSAPPGRIWFNGERR